MYHHKGSLFSHNVFAMLNNIPMAKQERSLADTTTFITFNMSATFLRMTLPHRKWKLISFHICISLFCFLTQAKEYNIFPPVNTELTSSAGSSLACPEQLFSVQLLLLSQLYKNRNYPKSWAEDESGFFDLFFFLEQFHCFNSKEILSLNHFNPQKGLLVMCTSLPIVLTNMLLSFTWLLFIQTKSFHASFCGD